MTDPGDAQGANSAGWQLLAKPDRTRDDLEAAVAAFRRSIEREPAVTHAVANLGDALVALDREAEALAELAQIAAGDGALAATAHNWLGWRLADRDRDRALGHLEAAVRLRPGWGVAWQNLARVRDGGGDVAGACTAYSEAIRCGDAHDDGFARDRRLQLEMMLLARGESVPAVPDAAQADSVAFAIVRAAAARLPAPQMFMVRPTTLHTLQAIIGTVHAGRALGHTIVGATGSAPWTATLAASGDVLDFDTTGAGGGRPGDEPAAAIDRAAAPLLAWLAGLDPAALTPIDAAIYVLDVVAAKLSGATSHGALSGPWRWQLERYRPAALAIVEPAGKLRVVVTARRGGGVELTLPVIGIGAAGQTLVCRDPAQLLAAAPAIEDAIRHAVAAREAFARRAFGVHHVATALAAAAGLGEPRLHDRYPQWPSASLLAPGALYVVASLVESATGCDIEIGRGRFTLRSADELTAQLPALIAAIATDRGRVRVERLELHDRFRVRASFGCFSPGSEIELASIAIISREGERAFTFAGLHSAAQHDLAELSDADAAILAELDRYLEHL